MSKTVKIPVVGADPFVVKVGDREYRYRAGSTVEAPEAVAAVIEHCRSMAPREDPAASDTPWAGALPAVTAADDGKVFGVLDGRAAAVPGRLVIGFTAEEGENGLLLEADVPFAKAAAAVSAGWDVSAKLTLEGAVMYFSLTALSPAESAPTILVFSNLWDQSGSDEAPAPTLSTIKFHAAGIAAAQININYDADNT